MRILSLLPVLVTLGVVGSPAHAQNPPPNAAQPGTPTTTPAPTAAAPNTTAVPPTPVAAPPPYPASPDSLVAPPGPPAPHEPEPPPPPAFQAPAPQPPPPPVAYYGAREPSPGMRRPPRYRYVEGTPLPEGYHLETRANRGLVFGGAAMLGIPYLIGTFGTLSVLGDGDTGWLAIPIAGPWLTLANRKTDCGEIGEPSPGGFECFSDEAGNGLLIASGIMQAVGTAMIALGLANTREYAVADYANLHITPVATPRGDYGLVLSGTL